MTEFEFERGELLSNLTLLEDHAAKFQCPYCMEKHSSKIIGYAEEISLGGEDQVNMKKLAKDARKWRRYVQGAKEHKHVGGTHAILPVVMGSNVDKEACVKAVRRQIKQGKLPKGSNVYAICRAKVK